MEADSSPPANIAMPLEMGFTVPCLGVIAGMSGRHPITYRELVVLATPYPLPTSRARTAFVVCNCRAARARARRVLERTRIGRYRAFTSMAMLHALVSTKSITQAAMTGGGL